MADCDMAKTVSPTPRKPSTTERNVGSAIAAVSGLRSIQCQAEIRHRVLQALTQIQSNA